MQTPIQFPAVLLELNASVAEVAKATSTLVCCTSATDASASPTPKIRSMDSRRVTSFHLLRLMQATFDALEPGTHEPRIREGMKCDRGVPVSPLGLTYLSSDSALRQRTG